MTKATTFGKKYFEVISSHSDKNSKNKTIKHNACLEYKVAKKQYKKDKPARLKKYQEEQEELLKTKDVRIAAKKAKKLEKNKIRKEKQAAQKTKENQNKEIVTEQTSITEQVPVAIQQAIPTIPQ